MERGLGRVPHKTSPFEKNLKLFLPFKLKYLYAISYSFLSTRGLSVPTSVSCIVHTLTASLVKEHKTTTWKHKTSPAGEYIHVYTFHSLWQICRKFRRQLDGKVIKGGQAGETIRQEDRKRERERICHTAIPEPSPVLYTTLKLGQRQRQKPNAQSKVTNTKPSTAKSAFQCNGRALSEEWLKANTPPHGHTLITEGWRAWREA